MVSIDEYEGEYFVYSLSVQALDDRHQTFYGTLLGLQKAQKMDWSRFSPVFWKIIRNFLPFFYLFKTRLAEANETR